MDSWKTRLRKLRKEKYPNASEFAEAVGISSATLNGWEKDEMEPKSIREISGPNLLKVCELLEISPEWFLHGKETWLSLNKQRNGFQEHSLPPELSIPLEGFGEIAVIYWSGSADRQSDILEAVRAIHQADEDSTVGSFERIEQDLRRRNQS